VAESSGMMFRGFENLLIGKDRATRRTSHSACAACALSATQWRLPGHGSRRWSDRDRQCPRHSQLNSRADFLHSHILHFYHLRCPAHRGPAMPPWMPGWEVDLRFNATDNQRWSITMCSFDGAPPGA